MWYDVAVEGKGVENAEESREGRHIELREHLMFLSALERPNPEERVLAIERYHVARELARRLGPAGAEFDRANVKKLLDTVAERLGVEE
jgi:hypothetical protein